MVLGMHALLVDDHPVIHEVLVAVLHKAFDSINVHCEETLEGAKRKAAEIGAIDLALIDLGLPGCDGIEALASFREKFPRIPTVVFSAKDDRASVVASLKAGAAGYIPKTLSPQIVIAALRLVHAGGIYLPPQVLSYLIGAPAQDDAQAAVAEGLTERQREVLRLLLRGHSNSRIAAELRIAEGTVKQHVHAIYDALGVSTRAELFAAAARAGIR